MYNYFECDKNLLEGRVREVASGKIYCVNLVRRECSCVDWHLNGVPCRHAERLIDHFELKQGVLSAVRFC